jgi:hypothetical protein
MFWFWFWIWGFFFEPFAEFLDQLLTGELRKQLQDANDAIAELQEGAKIKFQQRKTQDEEYKKMLAQYKAQQEETAKDFLDKDTQIEELQKTIELLNSKLESISEIIARK